MPNRNPIKRLLLIFFICALGIKHVYAGAAEDIITHHKLDMNNEKDRQNLLWIIEHDYPK